MIRSGFRRPVPAPRTCKQYTGDNPSAPRVPARVVVAMTAWMVAPRPKVIGWQNDAYMDIVRAMPCAFCGYSAARSQFCHSDMNKGTGTKTDCRYGWPGCGPHDEDPGCHWLVGTSGRLGKAMRREFEDRAARETRVEIIRRGLWPAGVEVPT